MSEASPQVSAEQIFTQFCDSNNFREILQLHSSLCSELGLDPNQQDGFYPELKSRLTSWKAVSLFQLLDARAAQLVYEGGKACAGRRALVIGAGPVGLRGAIELALLGARVDLVEKRPDFQRNNSLHLWPFLITDLRNLGAKKFYGKFASGSIDHICIRILQAVLLKICLLLGVKIYAGVTFKGLIEPKDTNTGWRIETTPINETTSSNEYDVILAADGKQHCIPGFRAKEFRAKLALAITVNYVNHNTQYENSVPEIGGVAFVYRQDFFNNLAKTHNIELENIVYYKDETHYFVMTVRKHSLIGKGVLKKDFNDPKQLLSSSNIDRKCLEQFALEATTFATEGGLGEVEFERNHRGENDVALFDFTSLFAAENAARIVERKGRRLLLCLAGDSLIEPFWPTGSGCARGFLGVFDNAWMIKQFCTGNVSPIELIEEREAILYLLPQTTPRRLSSNFSGYTIDPKTRYLNLSELVPPGDVSHLYDTDNQNALTAMKTRNPVPPTTQENSKPAVDHKSVEPTLKRSKSSEFASEAHSATSTPSQPHKQPLDEPSISDIKNMWRAKSVKNDRKPAKKNSEQSPTKSDHKGTLHDAKSIPKTKKTAAPEESKKATKDAKAVSKSSHEASKKKSAAKEHHPPGTGHSKISLVSSREKEPPISKQTKPTPVKQSGATQDKTQSPSSKIGSPKAKNTNKLSDSEKSTKSPKWSRFLPNSKFRARSQSPEPSPKQSKKQLGKDTKSPKAHPLQATRTRSLQDLNEASKTESLNVHEIAKKYDQCAESFTQRRIKQSGSRTATETEMKSGAKGASKSKDSPKPKKSFKSKEEKKEKSKKDKDSTKESKGGIFSFFKGRKSYNVAGAIKKSKSSSEEPLKELSEQPIVRQRIDQLRQSGLMTDGGEDPDVALVGVTSLMEDRSNEIFKSDGEEIQDFDIVSDEVIMADDGEIPSLEGSSPSSQLRGETPGSDGTSSPEARSETPNNGGSSSSPEGTANIEETPSDKGEPPKEIDENVERVKRLKEMFSRRPEPVSRHLSYTGRGSKEIDFSDILAQKSKAASSHPLWLARVTQGMSKCLERLRKEHDIVTVKTALEILNTIFSNVQAHPESDVYRRVRVSSESFSNKVWQLSEASQFLSRAGWMEIDEFIVLPVDAEVDNAKRVLDKHLNIVNHMMWSQQLELPQAGGRVRRPPTEKRRATTLYRRDSYSTRLVNESLQRIEEDAPSIPASNHGNTEIGNHGNIMATPTEQQTCEETDLAVSSGGPEEEQTMKAASAARNIWKQRSLNNERGRRESGCELIPDTVLYDLPPFRMKEGHSIESEQLVVDSQTSHSFVEVDARLLKLNQSGTRRLSGTEPQPAGSTPSPDNLQPQTTPTKAKQDDPCSPSGSAHSNQLKQLLGNSSLSQEDIKNEMEDGPKLTDAQHSTEHSIQNERVEYGNLTMEAAAQTRQKWRETEEATLKMAPNRDITQPKTVQ